jgi:hypothetical protein
MSYLILLAFSLSNPWFIYCIKSGGNYLTFPSLPARRETVSISGIQFIQSIYEQSTSSSAFAKRAEKPQEPASPQSDTVRISQEAMDRATNTADATAIGQELPLEAYSLPKWYAGLSSDLTLVDTQIGIPYSESRTARYDALSAREKKDLAEYQGTLHRYFREELDARGIQSAGDYYNQIVLDPETSEEVHQAVLQKLESDARAVQLMEYFGISA